MKALERLYETPIRVRHSELRRLNEDSAYRSRCPTCRKGILFVVRNQETLHLAALDRCSHCGQTFIYEDSTINGEIVDPAPDSKSLS